jgi:hypothetical protein
LEVVTRQGINLLNEELVNRRSRVTESVFARSEGVPSYLVETYLARGRAGERAACERRARWAAEGLTKGTSRVRFDRSIYVPEDEICFFVFDAPSGRDAAIAAKRAELDPIRVVEAVSSRKELP